MNLNHASRRPASTPALLGVGLPPALHVGQAPDPPPGARVVFDFETYPIAQGNPAPRPVVLAWRELEARTQPVNLLDAAAASAWVARNLPRADLTWIAHNAAFDLGVVAARILGDTRPVSALYRAGRVRCTVVREKLRNVACSPFTVPADLASCVRLRWGWTLTGKRRDDGDSADPWRVRYNELADVPLPEWPADALQYAADDVAWAAALYLDQQRPLELKTVWDCRAVTVPYAGGGPDEQTRTRAAWAAARLAAWGLRTDPEAVDAANRAYQADIAENRVILNTRGIIRDCGKLDTKALQAHVSAEWPPELGPVPTTPGGAVSTSKDTLTRLDTPLAGTLLRLREAEKIAQFISVAGTGARYPICAGYNVLVASGRWSCRGPNLQQMPRRGPVRECFVPRPGYVFLWVDYDSQELRCWAQVLRNIFGRSVLQQRYADDPEFDPHSAVGAQLLNVTYQEFRRLLKAGDKRAKDARQFAKPTNFGYMGGLGVNSFVDYARASYGQIIDLQQAKDLKNTWFRTWPEARPYLDWISANVEYASGVESCAFGGWTLPQFASGRIRAGCSYTNGANTLFQGLAADASTAALLAVMDATEDSTDPLFGARGGWFVHDEIGLQVREEQAHAAADRLIEIMQNAMQRFVPDVPARASATLARRWSKNAESTRGEDGKWTICF